MVLRRRQKASMEVAITCAGGGHRIEVVDGEALRLLDHGDAVAESALAALGGDACECVRAKHAWSQARVDLLPAPLAELSLKRWAAAGIDGDVARTVLALITGEPAPRRNAHYSASTAALAIIDDWTARLGRQPGPSDISRLITTKTT